MWDFAFILYGPYSLTWNSSMVRVYLSKDELSSREPDPEAGSKMKCQIKHQNNKLKMKNNMAKTVLSWRHWLSSIIVIKVIIIENMIKMKKNKPKTRTQIGRWTFSFWSANRCMIRLYDTSLRLLLIEPEISS